MATPDQVARTEKVDGASSAQLDRIRGLVSEGGRPVDEVLDAIADIVGDRRVSQPVYQKPLG